MIQDITVVKYLMNAIKNNYIDSIEIVRVHETKIILHAFVIDNYRIKPVLDMIEANMYVNKSIRAKSVECIDNSLRICTFNNIEYIIGVKSNK